MIDFRFSPEPGGNVPGTWFHAWRADEGEQARFQVGRRTYFKKQDRWGLAFYGASDDAVYRAADNAQFGQWAQLIEVTVAGEGLGRFTTLNTWDRAAFTFGFLQFGAHVPNGDFVRWFRALLARNEAAEYFPDLQPTGGRIARVTSSGIELLEDGASTAKLMAFLNPSGDRVDAPEILNAARLIDWTRRYPQTRTLQVELGVDEFRRILKAAAKSLPLDGESDAVCAVVADIRHQGRGTAQAVKAALAAADKLDALLRVGSDDYPERCKSIAAIVRRKLATGELGRHVYRKATAEFAPAAPAGPMVAAAAPAIAPTARIPFEHGPYSGNKDVIVDVPANFEPARPFVVTLFLHGFEVDGCSQQQQLDQVPRQILETRTNSILLAPRLGPQSQSDKWRANGAAKPEALAELLTEAAPHIDTILRARNVAPAVASAVGKVVAESASVVVVSFSGGCHPLRVLIDPAATTLDRIAGILLLDSLYNPPGTNKTTAAVLAWLKASKQRSWFVSLYGGTTKDNNKTVWQGLDAADYKACKKDWSKEVTDPLGPGVYMFCSSSPHHCQVPSEGPPAWPIVIALDRIKDDYAKKAPPPIS